MSQQNPFLSLDRQIVGDAYTSTETMDNLIILCDDFGSRFGGTEGERQAAEFFKAKMEEYGLSNVHLEPIEYVGWTRGEAKLEIVSPIQKTIPCISLPHSPPTDLEGVIFDIGDGDPKDFDQRADEINGNIIMTTSVVAPKGSKRWIHRGEKYGRSCMAGATGFIYVNHYPGYGPVTGGIGRALSLSMRNGDDGAGPIPAISVCKEDGAFIQRLQKRSGNVRIRLTTTDHCQPMTSWNIIGDLPGQQYPDQIVMMGSHYDGHDISQGAVDPASGTVSVLEAARMLAKHVPNLPCTVRFVLWGIEEIGLIGSREHVRAHADELSNIRFYLNLDSAGSTSNNRDIVLNEWPDLQPHFERWSEEMALGFIVGQSVMAYSDHFPFFMAGVPTGGVESAEESLSGRNYGHTQWDTVDKVDLRSLREASTLAARLALRMASEETWPVTKRDEKTVSEMLDHPEYQEGKKYRERISAYYEKIGRE
ncbi:MAG: M28 family peptidase [Chloroflexi bacterium]|nr:M28 family peptidase [Chloroflexota bacterium]